MSPETRGSGKIVSHLSCVGSRNISVDVPTLNKHPFDTFSSHTNNTVVLRSSDLVGSDIVRFGGKSEKTGELNVVQYTPHRLDRSLLHFVIHTEKESSPCTSSGHVLARVRPVYHGWDPYPLRHPPQPHTRPTQLSCLCGHCPRSEPLLAERLVYSRLPSSVLSESSTGASGQQILFLADYTVCACPRSVRVGRGAPRPINVAIIARISSHPIRACTAPTKTTRPTARREQASIGTKVQ